MLKFRQSIVFTCRLVFGRRNGFTESLLVNKIGVIVVLFCIAKPSFFLSNVCFLITVLSLCTSRHRFTRLIIIKEKNYYTILLFYYYADIQTFLHASEHVLLANIEIKCYKLRKHSYLSYVAIRYYTGKQGRNRKSSEY